MLPPPVMQPTPLPPAALPADTYATRHSAWHQACDVILRENDQALRIWQVNASSEINSASTAAQTARAAAEQNVAAAGLQAAAAQLAAAQAIAAPMAPMPPPTDADLLRSFMLTYIESGAGSVAVLGLAKARLAEFKAAIRPSPSAPK